MPAAVLLFALAISSGSPQKPILGTQERIMARFKANPLTFNPHFGHSDASTAIPPRFLSFTPVGSSLSAQKLGAEKNKELSRRLSRSRLPLSIQFSL